MTLTNRTTTTSHQTLPQQSPLPHIYNTQSHTLPLSALRCGVLVRLVLLWLVIICLVVMFYLLLFTNMQAKSLSMRELPDAIKVLGRLSLNSSDVESHSRQQLHLLSLEEVAAAASQPNQSPVTVESESTSTVNREEARPESETEAETEESKRKEKEGFPSSSSPSATRSNSKYAYVTLLHGIDETFAYRGYLYNCIIMKESLRRLGSKMDFIVMVGFLYPRQLERNNAVTDLIKKDLKLLQYYDIKLYYLPRLHSSHSLELFFSQAAKSVSLAELKLYNPTMLDSLKHKFSKQKVNFLEMALLKITPWNFTSYERVQYMDGDILPFENMDCLFQLTRNTFNTGTASPINSGWFLAITNQSDYQRLLSLTVPRFMKKWNEIDGWGKKLPPDIFYRGQDRVVKKWEFNGASLDQGLCTHYFALLEGRIQLLDVRDALIYDPMYKKTVLPKGLEEVVDAICPGGNSNGKKGKSSMDFFYHFTGRNKPWLQNLSKPKDKGVKLWVEILNSLKLSINSTTINGNSLKPPLGYFHPNNEIMVTRLKMLRYQYPNSHGPFRGTPPSWIHFKKEAVPRKRIRNVNLAESR